MPFGLQVSDLIIIVVVALLLFGPKRLPEIGRYIGKTLTEFRAGTQELTRTLREEISQPVQHQTAPPPPAQPTTTTDANAGNFCVKCGASNTPNALFCINCGKALTPKQPETQ